MVILNQLQDNIYNLIHPQLVDCQWDKWKTGECSKTCGGGKLFIERKKITEASNGGKECSGNSTIIHECNVEHCPGILRH